MIDFSQLKVCFLAGTLEHGGAERQLFYLVQMLQRQGAEPRVLAFDRGEVWEERIRSLGVPVTWIGQHASRFMRLGRVLLEVRRIKPAILQTQHFFTNFYAAAAGRALRLREIGALRNDGRSEWQGSGRTGGWLNLRLPRFLAANSRAAMRYAVSMGVAPGRLHFLPNVVETARWRTRPRAESETLRLLAIGRLVPQKRFDRFLTILARVRAALPGQVRATIVGAGPLLASLQHQATALGLSAADVEFKGAVTDMESAYADADVCVLTSDHEGTPNVLLEAMAAGLPVVAARVGGVPDIVPSGRGGLIFDREDLDGFAEGLVELARKPGWRIALGRGAQTWVERHFSIERLPALVAELYDKVLPDWHPARRRGVVPNVGASPSWVR